MDTKYNPLAEAAKVAIAELTGEKAQQSIIETTGQPLVTKPSVETLLSQDF